MGEYVWLDADEATTLPDAWAVEVLRDMWWVTDAANRICFWRERPGDEHLYPQANAHRTIAERRCAAIPDATGILLLPIVLRPHRCSDYR